MHALNLTSLEWVGAMDLEPLSAGGLQPWRLPLALLDFLDERTRFQAGNPSGVRLRWAGRMRRVEMEVAPSARKRWFDLTVDDQLAGRVELAPQASSVVFDDLPAGDKVVELWLNHMYDPVIVRALRADASARPAPPSGKKRILFHGSSITHGRGAAGPAETWPAGAARRLGLEPINLGLGGACRLEPALARVIRDLPADFLSFCLGVNVVMGRSHNERAFRGSVIGLIQIVREGHPRTPLMIQGPIFCRQAEHYDDPGQFSLTRCREVLQEVVECCRRHGDEKICYGGDLQMLGAAEEAMLFDGVHPDADGYRLMSRRYAEIAWPRLAALAED